MALTPQQFEQLKEQLRQRRAPTLGNLGSRIWSDLSQRGENVVTEITRPGQNPLLSGIKATGQAFGGVGDVGANIAETVAPTLTKKVGETVEKGFSTLTSKIGETKLFKSAAESGQTKTLEDVLSGVSAGGEIVGGILGAEGARFGVRGTSDVLRGSAKKTLDIAKDLAGKVTPDAAKIMQRVARVSKGKQQSFEAMAGESIGSYLDSRGIYGGIEDISEQLYKRFSESKLEADNALASLSGSFKATPIKTALEELYKREVRVSSPGALSKDLRRVRELVNKYNKEGLDMSEINEVKRLYERNVRLDFVKQNLPESVARSTNIDNALRAWQFDQAQKLGLKNLPEINKETRLAKQLVDDIGKEYSGVAGNNAITLTDWVILAGGDPTAIAAFLAKKGISSKSLQAEVAKFLSKHKEKKPVPKAQIGTPRKDFIDLGSTVDRTTPQQQPLRQIRSQESYPTNTTH